MTPSLTVVIPAYRATRTIADVIGRVKATRADATVIVVDDGSRDDTAERARAAGATVVEHAHNQGKGRALATGIAAALQSPATRLVVTLDSDGQHPPEALATVMSPLEQGTVDLVVGARERAPGVMPASRRLSNWLSSSLVSRAVGRAIPDSQSGYRAMTREVAEAVRPAGKRYEYETEFLLDAAARGFRIGAVTIPTVYAGEPSHFRYLGDTLRVSAVFLKHWRQLVFSPTPRTPHPAP